MSSASVHASGQGLPSSTGAYATAPNLSYLDHHNADSYYANAAASGSGSLPLQQDRRAQQSQQQYAQGQNEEQYMTYNEEDQYDGTAPIPPPRSSSQQNAFSPQRPTAPSTAPLEARMAASRQARQTADTQSYRDYQDISQERPRDESSNSASRNRRKGPTSPDGSQQATSSRERGQQNTIPNQSRSEAPVTTTNMPAPLTREYSEVINRVVVSDPRVDAERVQDRVAEAQPTSVADETSPRPTGWQENESSGPGPARRQDYSKSSSKRRDVQFGDYMLGQTLGEGEFGKVKLGWKKDGSTQVAIKLIRRDTVQSHPGRLPKIYREISILRDLAHPNIVRLHEMVETERHIGIILEYASGGELFDYILNHRYLKDPAARKLFAQLVSGVGYLHKKGIVHRDLKLENLLLDQNKNIIITDFGFANTFNQTDSLSDEIEYNLSNKDFVRKFKLDRLDAKGMRRGDLMQTSCGSPCYAAPELVVSDSLYTGRKVDVWSCGVILYAMLAGYLPFDDDPANPEGDNINLLYKYITTTPLTFPEYVSPHARDLLRRILVPDPRKRADLFEVARHSWLSDYQHVVAHVGSTTNIAESASNGVPGLEPLPEPPVMNRSASVRDAPKPASQASPTIARTPEGLQQDRNPSSSKRDRGTRHTLQPEYVAPTSHTARGQAPAPMTSQPEEKTALPAQSQSLASKPLPRDPPSGQQAYQNAVDRSQRMPPPTRPARDVPRSASDHTGAFGVSQPAQNMQYSTRPTTQGSMTSSGPTRSDLRLPSRGSYGQPVAPTVATTNAEGRVTQPSKNARGYNISGPVPPQHGQPPSMGQPMTQQMPSAASQQMQKGHHRRSSTLSNLSERLFGRSSSVRKKDDARQTSGRRYPPTSMKPYNVDGEAPAQPRMSTDSKRSFSLGLGKKRSTDLESQNEKSSGGRRFSLLPKSTSFKNLMGGNKNQEPEAPPVQEHNYSRPSTNQEYQPQRVASNDGQYEGPRPAKYNNYSRPPQAQQPRQDSQSSQPAQGDDVYGGTGVYTPSQGRSQHARGASQPMTQFRPQYPDGFNDEARPNAQPSRQRVLTKPNRRFDNAYDEEPGHHSGSSGAVRKVQDFFRRRGRARADSGYK